MTDRAPTVLTACEGKLGLLTLNRPEALHALNLDMVTRLTDALLSWRGNRAVSAVLLDHAPDTRGFCAGGDIRMLAESGAGDSVEARAFFHAEYRLNHLIHTYPKPIVALIDGVTMGGGVGLSVHSPIRIATERTVFAMPETGIGLFPDVGGGWFLPRLPNQIGVWLALTGARLKAADCLVAGVATHFIPTELVGAARAQIAGAAQTADAARAIASGLDALDEPAGAARELTDANRKRIAHCFAFDSVEEIVAALESDGSDWAKSQIAIMALKSPQTLKVALRQIREGGRMASFAEVMAMEYRIGARVVCRPDFLEGVRAVIVDKDNAPQWNPASLAGVDRVLLDAIFAPLPDDEEWTAL
jgi:enoyl-CoA hydratase